MGVVYANFTQYCRVDEAERGSGTSTSGLALTTAGGTIHPTYYSPTLSAGRREL
tara:strand:+ start:76407 stop:76568 length:162 start_codon:yes stop_codon:yes gene_type:complete